MVDKARRPYDFVEAVCEIITFVNLSDRLVASGQSGGQLSVEGGFSDFH
jgi:hypothetical protein